MYSVGVAKTVMKITWAYVSDSVVKIVTFDNVMWSMSVMGIRTLLDVGDFVNNLQMKTVNENNLVRLLMQDINSSSRFSEFWSKTVKIVKIDWKPLFEQFTDNVISIEKDHVLGCLSNSQALIFYEC